jgi:hypothetical protein
MPDWAVTHSPTPKPANNRVLASYLTATTPLCRFIIMTESCKRAGLLELTDQLEADVAAIFGRLDAALEHPYQDADIAADQERVLATLDAVQQALQENMLDTLMPCPAEKSVEETIKECQDRAESARKRVGRISTNAKSAAH